MAVAILDEDELKWVANEKNILLLLKQFHENVLSKTPRCRKLTHFSGENDALMHCEGLRFNPFKPEFTIIIFFRYKMRIAVANLDL